MALSALSLPIDIPWRRVCVSADMLDRTFCDRKFPYRWRSSVAAFIYEPPADEQQYEDQVIAYLKVVSTITGFQPDPEEVGLKDRRIDSYWNDPAVIENYKNIVAQYYPCFGAILEVAVAPGREQRDIPAYQYPYFLDFDPKKRELYEVVTDTGESMSRSLDDVNVRKGMTTSNAREVVDLFGGVSANFSYGGAGGGISPQGQVGHRDMSQDDYTNVRTTDSAREARETYSHTTQLTQMYHQLDSYHLGTNRSVFFMLPRPHVVQSAITFANGPRQLEGVQEFFFVIARPKHVDKVCIEAYLETAHVASEPQFTYEQSTGTQTLHIDKKVTEDRDCFDCFGDDSYAEIGADSAVYNPPDGWEIDLDKNGGYQITSVSGANIVSAGVTEIDRYHAIVAGSVMAKFIDKTWPVGNEFQAGSLDLTVTIYIRKKVPDITGYSQNLWLTGRGICCCDEQDPAIDRHLRDSVTYESTLFSDVHVAVGGGSKIEAHDANNLRGSIATELRRSVNHPARYERGTTQFLDTAFLGRTMSRLLRKTDHPDNNALSEIDGIAGSVAKKIAHVAPLVSRGRLLTMPRNEIVDRFALTPDEALEVRRAALGLTAEPVEPSRRWDRRGASGSTIVPDVVGLSLDDARARMRAAILSTNHVTYVDHASPRGTVLDQNPPAGRELLKRSEVELQLASGVSVQIPDLVGKSLTDAIVALRAAGLAADPTIRYVRECRSPKVLSVEPEPRKFVMPNEHVVLVLGDEDDEEDKKSRKPGHKHGY